jgi:hypothetical protein
VRSPLRRPAAVVLLLPTVAGALELSSCGGGGDSGDAKKQLNQAFRTRINSADLKLTADVKVKGSSALSKPIRIQASGPYRMNKGKLPSLDIGLNISAGGGQTVQTGFLSTGDRSFVKFQDLYYEQPQSQVRQANRQLATRGRRGSLKSLGLDPRSWLKDAKEKGDEDVAGTSTTHIAGKLNVEKVVRDFNDFVGRSGRSFGPAGQVPQRLSESDIKKVTDVVKDPNFDVYVAKTDHTVRRVAAHVELQVPKRDRAAVGGIQGGALDLSIELSKVNGNQQIVAPARARPLSDLTKTLGAGALGGLGGGTGTTPTPPSTGGSGGTSTTPNPDAFKKYADCLDKAKSQDTQALQRCAKLLR